MFSLPYFLITIKSQESLSLSIQYCWRVLCHFWAILNILYLYLPSLIPVQCICAGFDDYTELYILIMCYTCFLIITGHDAS